MDLGFLVVVLALGTMLAFVLFALWNKEKVEARKANGDAPKSTLAADKSSTGKPVDV